MPKRDFLKFPRASGHVKMAGEGSGVRPSDRIRQDTEDGDEHRSDLQGETDEPDSAEPQQEQDDLEAKHDVWSISGSFIYRHHVPERQFCTCHSKAHFPFHTKLDVLQDCQIDRSDGFFHARE